MYTKEKMMCQYENAADIDSEDIIFFLEYDGSLYAVEDGNEPFRYIHKVRCDIYGGFCTVSGEIPDDVVSISEKLLARHEKNSEKYPLEGEWYRARIYTEGGVTRLNIRKTRSKHAMHLMHCISKVIHLTLAFLWAAIVLLLQMDEAHLWLSSLFPSFEVEVLEPIVFALELGGVTALFVLFSNSAGIFDIFFNTIIPIGLIFIMGMIKMNVWLLLAVLFLLVLLYFFAKDTFSQIYRYREGSAMAALNNARLALIMLIVFLSLIYSVPFAREYIEPVGSLYDTGALAERLEAEHDEVCDKLWPITWNGLSTEERIEVLADIADYECVVVLGILPVDLTCAAIAEEEKLGYYSYADNTVVIDIDVIENGGVELAVEVVLHETRHAYQYRLTEMYDLIKHTLDERYDDLLVVKDMRELWENGKNYITPEDDPEGYTYQPMERDSREWTRKRINEHYIYYVTLL